jgi:hypothetical protein
MRFLLVLALLFSYSFADRDGGPYIGIGYGESLYDDDNVYEDILEEKVGSLTYYGGAYINKHLSVEIGYIKATDGKYKVLENNVRKRLDYTLYNVSTLAHYAFFDDFWDFYLKFGAGYVKYDGEKGFSYLYGVGTSLRLSELISLKVAYDIYEFGYDEDGDNGSDYNMRISYPYVAVEFQF